MVSSATEAESQSAFRSAGMGDEALFEEVTEASHVVLTERNHLDLRIGPSVRCVGDHGDETPATRAVRERLVVDGAPQDLHLR